MFFTLPPAPPAMVYVASAPAPGDDMIASECKRGSRDCFPEDRVGHQPSVTETLILTAKMVTPRQDGSV
jgi:hypothetical protein